MSIRVYIDYTNWKGERGERLISPGRMYYGQTEYHPRDQWLLSAMDHGKQAERTFAMKDIHRWRPAD